MKGHKLRMKYLFVATLMDGSVVKQDQRDVCPTDPKRTAFWPLVAKDKAGNPLLGGYNGGLKTRQDIRSFMLVGPEQRFMVDLVDGHFEIDGQRVGTIDGKPMIQPPPLVPLSLVYFRRRREHLSQQTGEHVGSDCEYHFGWQAPTGHEQLLILQ